MPHFFSSKYDDIYFNQDEPEAEKQFVFLGGNNLDERLRSLSAGDDFTVAELGFGFGLNYALTLHAAKRADVLHQLRYFSVEESFPESAQVEALEEKLGICRGEFGSRPAGVYHGDVVSFLSDARFAADAWYFDGFSPAKNPAMWSEEVFALAFARTRPGGTFSTYTAAGWVKRNLEAAGFVVEKTKGFASKREMLKGYRPAQVHL